MRVLVASSDVSATDWLQAVLHAAGLTVIVMAEPSPTAPELAGSELLIADRAAAEALGDDGPKRRLLLVPRGQAVDLADAMSGGFMDLLIVPSPEDEVLNRVGRALDHFHKPASMPSGARSQVDEMKAITGRVVEALKASGPNAERTVRELTEGMLSVFVLVIDSHESTDRGTPAHSRRVGVLMRALSAHMGRSDEDAAWLELAGRLHDIGLTALGLPLAGEAPLSLEVRRVVQSHPELSVEILEPLGSWGLPLDAIAGHHERIDGSGYPDGLSGADVSTEAQLLGAADAFEALTSPRPWRPAETREAALEAMRTGGGFRAEVLDALETISAKDMGPPGPLPQPPSRR